MHSIISSLILEIFLLHCLILLFTEASLDVLIILD